MNLMTLGSLSSSILEAFETLGLNVEQIAATQELEPVVVKSVLLQYSSKYREECGKKDENEEMVGKEEVKGYLAAYKMLAHSDDDFLRERVLRNLINVGLKVTDGLGENNPRKLLQELGGAGNIIALNAALQKAKEAKERVMKNTIDIESTELCQ
jgi:molybdopterin converting factor small subunit